VATLEPVTFRANRLGADLPGSGPRPRQARASGLALGSLLLAPAADAQSAAPAPGSAAVLTRRQRGDADDLPEARPVAPLSELNAQLERQGFYKAFPPPGIEVVSWYVMMGIGQVVTIRLLASRLREVNRIFETSAWGAYHTEFYPTYDLKSVGLDLHAKAQ
jgi:hypothetical protein